MHEYTYDPRAAQKNRRWLAGCGAMAAVLLVSLAAWGLVLSQNAQKPLCWLWRAEPILARPAQPPEGEGMAGQNAFYEVAFALQNEGERAVPLYDYVLGYEPARREYSAWCWSGDSAPLLRPERVLPAGQTVRFTQLVEVWGSGSPEDAFPLEVRYQPYEQDLLLGYAELADG